MNDLEELAVLDPARHNEPTDAQWNRSRAFVERTMASAPASRPRWLAAGAVTVAAAALGVAGAVVVPALFPGATQQAIASWTAVPTARTGDQVLDQAKTCGKSDVEGSSTQVRPSDVILAEQRGDATMIIMRKTNGHIVECLGVGDAGFASMGLTDGTPLPPPPAGKLTLETRSSYGDGDDMFSNIIGLAGPGVTSIELRLNDGGTIQASVKDGWWGAWWPGPEGGEGTDEFTVTAHTATGKTVYLPSEMP
jgi:hypothetical protein